MGGLGNTADEPVVVNTGVLDGEAVTEYCAGKDACGWD